MNTNDVPTPFDFSVNSAAAISAGSPTLPFDFSQNTASAVTATQGITGFDFSVNTASSLTTTQPPAAFNFADKSTAVSGGVAAGQRSFSNYTQSEHVITRSRVVGQADQNPGRR